MHISHICIYTIYVGKCRSCVALRFPLSRINVIQDARLSRHRHAQLHTLLTLERRIVADFGSCSCCCSCVRSCSICANGIHAYNTRAMSPSFGRVEHVLNTCSAHDGGGGGFAFTFECHYDWGLHPAAAGSLKSVCKARAGKPEANLCLSIHSLSFAPFGFLVVGVHLFCVPSPGGRLVFSAPFAVQLVLCSISITTNDFTMCSLTLSFSMVRSSGLQILHSSPEAFGLAISAPQALDFH